VPIFAALLLTVALSAPLNAFLIRKQADFHEAISSLKTIISLFIGLIAKAVNQCGIHRSMQAILFRGYFSR